MKCSTVPSFLKFRANFNGVFISGKRIKKLLFSIESKQPEKHYNADVSGKKRTRYCENSLFSD